MLNNIGVALLKLHNEWHHVALSNGEYPTTIDELLFVRPEYADPEKYEVSAQKSQFTNKHSVMVRCKIREKMEKENPELLPLLQ